MCTTPLLWQPVRLCKYGDCMETMGLEEDALDYHRRDPPGKIEVSTTKHTDSQNELSLASTPGVATPCDPNVHRRRCILPCFPLGTERVRQVNQRFPEKWRLFIRKNVVADGHRPTGRDSILGRW